MIVRAVSRADALKQGGNAMGTLNAANEVAVEHFLNNKISFSLHKR
jgi:1-deoxy-D-xylulose 5-phosphate reductoisomerase